MQKKGTTDGVEKAVPIAIDFETAFCRYCLLAFGIYPQIYFLLNALLRIPGSLEFSDEHNLADVVGVVGTDMSDG